MNSMGNVSKYEMIRVAPIPITHALRFIKKHHRHLKKCSHRLWAVGLWQVSDDDREVLAGVAVVAQPAARMLANTKPDPNDEFPPPWERLEVVRLAVADGIPNGCSMLYGACSRAAKAMGATDLLTYTRCTEPGTSLRAAGWFRDEGEFGGGQATRPSRRRKLRNSDEIVKRHRWWAPWSSHLK